MSYLSCSKLKKILFLKNVKSHFEIVDRFLFICIVKDIL